MINRITRTKDPLYVTRLLIISAGIQSIEEDLGAKYPNLVSITAGDNPGLNIDTFSSFPQLTSLSLWNCSISQVGGDAHVLGVFTRLSYLDLSNNVLDATVWQPLSHLFALETLNLENNRITALPTRGRAGTWAKLHHLFLANNPVAFSEDELRRAFPAIEDFTAAAPPPRAHDDAAAEQSSSTFLTWVADATASAQDAPERAHAVLSRDGWGDLEHAFDAQRGGRALALDRLFRLLSELVSYEGHPKLPWERSQASVQRSPCTHPKHLPPVAVDHDAVSPLTFPFPRELLSVSIPQDSERKVPERHSPVLRREKAIRSRIGGASDTIPESPSVQQTLRSIESRIANGPNTFLRKDAIMRL